MQDFSNSFVYVFFSISLKSIIAFGTFFHCLEIEMHKSAQWIKNLKKSLIQTVFSDTYCIIIVIGIVENNCMKNYETLLSYFLPL